MGDARGQGSPALQLAGSVTLGWATGVSGFPQEMG